MHEQDNSEDQGMKPSIQDKTEDSCLVSVDCYQKEQSECFKTVGHTEGKKEKKRFRGNLRSGSHFGDKNSLKERA